MPLWRCGRVGLDRGDHEVGVDAVGDEGLRAVDDVVVAVADRGRGHRRRGRSRCRARSWRSAVISSPEQMPGSHRAFCSSVVSVRKYGRQMSLCSVSPSPARVDPGPLDLLARSRRCSGSPPRRRRRSASGTAMPRKPWAPAFANSSRSTMPACSHASWCGDDLLGDERADASRGTARARPRTGCAPSRDGNAMASVARVPGRPLHRDPDGNDEGELRGAGLRGWPTYRHRPTNLIRVMPAEGIVRWQRRARATGGGDRRRRPRRASPPRRRCPSGTRVVAADSGVDHARPLGLAVDLVVGDLDSVVAGSLGAGPRRRAPASSATRRQGRHRPRPGARRRPGARAPRHVHRARRPRRAARPPPRRVLLAVADPTWPRHLDHGAHGRRARARGAATRDAASAPDRRPRHAAAGRRAGAGRSAPPACCYPLARRGPRSPAPPGASATSSSTTPPPWPSTDGALLAVLPGQLGTHSDPPRGDPLMNTSRPLVALAASASPSPRARRRRRRSESLPARRRATEHGDTVRLLTHDSFAAQRRTCSTPSPTRPASRSR